MTARINLSANIENGMAKGSHYIGTPNARRCAATIIGDYHSGIHSFTIIGSYGTGKSSFLVAIEDDLRRGGARPHLIERGNLSGATTYDIVNVVGDYEDLSTLLKRALGVADSRNSVVDELKHRYNVCRKQGAFLVLVIDEFGKVLEHAARNNPEKELYLIQKIAELINSPDRDALLLTTLHQNFGAYAKGLSAEQANEWAKVKGRFKEITFVEPIEQILELATNQYVGVRIPDGATVENLHRLAIETHFVAEDLPIETAERIYPLDPFSAYVLAAAIRRYGQNERSLFTFLGSRGNGTVANFGGGVNRTYNVAMVYDYILNNFMSYIRDANMDSLNWGAMRGAIERVEGHKWADEKQMFAATALVKTIGLANLLGVGGYKMDQRQLAAYAASAMDIDNAMPIIHLLEERRIVRYAEYRERLVLFEGTDVDLEEELRRASMVVSRPVRFVDELNLFFNKRISPVKAHYYQKGTPRFFEYKVLDNPLNITPEGDTDGYIELVFSTDGSALTELLKTSSNSTNALIFVYFKNTDEIVEHLYKLKKFRYLIERVVDRDDRVAVSEIKKMEEYEEGLLNKAIGDNLFAYKDRVVWIFRGEIQRVESQRDFNQLLSRVCDTVYPQTPVMCNELFNRHKLSSTISTARKNYLVRMVEHHDEQDFGFPNDKFPPEKTIYYSLLKNTGLHVNGEFRDTPVAGGFMPLWIACEDFLATTENKGRKISELRNMLLGAPYKLKQGLLDFWIPTYLFMRRQEYALYNSNNGSFIPSVNIEFFELLQKRPSDFEVKKFAVDGVKLGFFNQYRKFVNLGQEFTIKSSSFIETIKPLLSFYMRLNTYAKHTRKLDHDTTLRFRDVLATAKDPEKAFFEDLPEALGFDGEKLKQKEQMDEYGVIIQRAIRELRNCYPRLIDRLEERLVEGLGLQSYEFDDYFNEIQKRMIGVRTYLMTAKLREFYQHATTEYDSRIEWYQSICYTILESRLDTLRDEQEEKLAEDLVRMFRECEKYADISKISETDDDGLAYSFDLVTNKGTNIQASTFYLPETERIEAEKLLCSLETRLSGNRDLDVCVLLELLNKKLKK